MQRDARDVLLHGPKRSVCPAAGKDLSENTVRGKDVMIGQVVDAIA